MTDLDEFENKLDELPVTHGSYPRVFRYFSEVLKYLPEGEDIPKWKSLFNLAMKSNRKSLALLIAMRLEDQDLIKEVYNSVPAGSPEQRQFAFMMAETQIRLEVPEPGEEEEPQEEDEDTEKNEESIKIMNGSLRSKLLQKNAQSLSVLEPKSPEDVYKSHLVETRRMSGLDAPAAINSKLDNLAKTMVSAIVNCGFGTDTLMLHEGSNWAFQHANLGITCAVASLGLLFLWDEDSVDNIEKYLDSPDAYAKAGAILGIGAMFSGVISEFDVVQVMLGDYLQSEDLLTRCCTYLAFGLAYSCTNRVSLEMLPEPLLSSDENTDVVVCASLACGMVFAGSGNDAIFQAIFQALNERAKSGHVCLPLMSVALGLIHLQRRELAEAAIAECEELPEEVRNHAAITIEACAYAGSGDVLALQRMLDACTEEGKEVAALGVALIALGEKLGTEMSLRHYERMVQFGSVNLRRYVALGLGLLSCGQPLMGALPFLSRLTHDHSKNVSFSALIGLGLMAAGTNNGATAKLFRELSDYHAQDAQLKFITRIGQALVHLGKGILTVSPVQYDGVIINKPALVGLIPFLYVIAQCKDLILGEHTFFLFTLVPAIRSRCITTVSDDNTPCEVTLRLGNATDVAGLPGRPNIVTGFQTMTSPVVLQALQRVQFTDPKWVPLTDIADGVVVVVQRTKDMEDEDEDEESDPGLANVAVKASSSSSSSSSSSDSTSSSSSSST